MANPRPTVDENRAIFEEIFPQLDLAAFLERHKERELDWVIDYIISHPKEFRMKVKKEEVVDGEHLKDEEVFGFDDDYRRLPSSSNFIECIVCLQEFPKEHGFECCPVFDDYKQSKEVSFGPINFISSFIRRLCISNTPSTRSIHIFCIECVRGHALASINGSSPVAHDAQGLCCMAANCSNTILYSSIATFLPSNVRMKLSERLDGQAVSTVAEQLKLEHCKMCSFSALIEVSPDVDKVFKCLKCGYAYCRICDVSWNKHFGKKCSELTGGKLELEKKMNEVVVRKCPRCSLQFVKEANCNRMVCRCGLSMCYICRESNIDYSHFCKHPLDPGKKCSECKSCLLWEDYKLKDNQELARLKNEYKKKAAKKVAK